MLLEASKPYSGERPVLGEQHSNESIGIYSSPIKKPCQQLFWRNVFFYTYFHITAICALIQFPPQWYTVLLNLVLYVWVGFSITAGCHRLWAHKSYKAKWPLRLFLAVGQCFAVQFSIYKWVWLHRVHHKFTDTDADPHNSKRGFFYSHIGWILHQHHVEVLQKKETIDLSDLEEDRMIMWQDKLYPVVGPLCCFLLPTLVPFYLWGEDFLTAWNFSVFRFLIFTHVTSIVNSIAHMWGTRSYDSNISSSNNVFVSIIAFGEGAHNYHHVFPWDYKTAESKSYFFNLTLLFLDFCTKLGLAYDFKEASPEMIQKRKLRTGDGGTEPHFSERQVWGLEDEDMDEQEKKMVKCLHPTENKKSY